MYITWMIQHIVVVFTLFFIFQDLFVPRIIKQGTFPCILAYTARVVSYPSFINLAINHSFYIYLPQQLWQLI
jgi:hypothetical protein